RPVLLAGLTAALLPAVIPLETFSVNANFQALALVPWIAVDRIVPWLVIALPVCIVLGVVFVRASLRPVRGFVPVTLVLLMLVLVGVAGQGPMRWASEWTRAQAWGERADWVDAAIGSAGDVSVLWYEPPGESHVPPAPRHRVLWIGELFNRSLGPVYEIGSPLAYALPASRARVGGGRVRSGGKLLRLSEPLLFAPCHVLPKGEVIALDRRLGRPCTESLRLCGWSSPTRARAGSRGAEASCSSAVEL
ncbi:MAG: hypothetical protein RMM28_11560, partial [Thermoleophilia bacterium]|nr:hypothetical protein [Thermoleophilia bacterium]